MIYFSQLYKFVEDLFTTSNKDFPKPIDDPRNFYYLQISESKNELNFTFLKNLCIDYIAINYVVEVEKKWVLEALDLLKEEFIKKTKEFSFYLNGLEIINNFKDEYLSEKDFKNFLGKYFTSEAKTRIVAECGFNDTTHNDIRIYRSKFLYYFYDKYLIIKNLTTFYEYLCEKIEDVLKTHKNKICFNSFWDVPFNQNIESIKHFTLTKNEFTSSVPINIELKINNYIFKHPVAFKLDENSQIIESQKPANLGSENRKNKIGILDGKFFLKNKENKIIFHNTKKEKILNISFQYHVNCDKDIFIKAIENGTDILYEQKRDRRIVLDTLEFINNRTGDISIKDLKNYQSLKNYQIIDLHYFLNAIKLYKKEENSEYTYYDRKKLYLHCLKEVFLYDHCIKNKKRVTDERNFLKKSPLDKIFGFFPLVLLDKQDYNLNDNQLEINSKIFNQNIPFSIKIVTPKNIYVSRRIQKNYNNKIFRFISKYKNVLPDISEESDNQEESHISEESDDQAETDNQAEPDNQAKLDISENGIIKKNLLKNLTKKGYDKDNLIINEKPQNFSNLSNYSTTVNSSHPSASSNVYEHGSYIENKGEIDIKSDEKIFNRVTQDSYNEGSIGNEKNTENLGNTNFFKKNKVEIFLSILLLILVVITIFIIRLVSLE